MKKHHLGVAAALLFLPLAYAAQAGMKLKRTLGPDVSLSDCRFSVYTERADLGALSLPLPKISCMATPKRNVPLEYVWLPTRNAWQGPIKTGC